MSEAWAVVFVDRRELPLGKWPSLLSTQERAEVATYRHPERLARTLTSRVLTKYLVTQPCPSEFCRLQAKQIESVRSTEWKSIELLSGTSSARVTGAVIRAGKPAADLSISSSHCGAYTASCISRHHVGIDLERAEPRRREFYTGVFSAQERDWAQRVHARGASIEAAFTMLWTVKEAYLKASDHPDLSIWSFPSWTVWLDSSVTAGLRPKSDEEFIRVPGGIHSHSFSAMFQIATMRVNDMVLTTVQYERSSNSRNSAGSVR